MVFEYILKQKGIDIEKDLTINQNIDFGSTAAAFSEGQADFTVEFEPGATTLEKGGKGYVVASLGEDSGYVPYTAFSAKKSYIEKIKTSFRDSRMRCKRNGLRADTYSGRNCKNHCTTVQRDRLSHYHNDCDPLL